MAKAPVSQTEYDPETLYILGVSKPVQLGPFKYLPRDAITAKGSVINRIVEQEGADAIRTAVKK